MISEGIHSNVTAEDYHADPCERPSLSASLAHILTSRSPRHAWAAHPHLNPEHERIDEARFDVGTVTHELLLRGEQLAGIVDAADWRTNAAKEQRDIARAEGLIPMLAHQWREVEQMVSSVREQIKDLDAAPALFTDGKPEQTLVWEDSGILCRARLDWLRNDFTAIDDLKSTARSANPADWTRTTLWAIGADVQVAFYTRGVKKLTGRSPEFRFLVAETQAPYAVAPVALAPSSLEIAARKVDYAIACWRWCLDRGKWPAYTPQIAYAEMPPWEMERWLERERDQEERVTA